MALDLKKHIRGVPDFPKEGILFYDIGTLLAHGPAFAQAIDRMAELVASFSPDVLVGIDARGFVFAAPCAARLNLGLVLARKKGKLPGETIAHTYALEYGSATLELQTGVIPAGARVLVVDDLLATGGTAAAAVSLVQRAGGTVVGAAFLIELSFLNGRKNLSVPVHSILDYDA